MRKGTAVLFREKQRFRLGYRGIALAIPPVSLVVITLRQVVWRLPWGSPPVTDGDLVFLTILTLLVYGYLMSVRLVTELRPEYLSVAMKGLWQHRHLSVAEIRSAKVVEYDPLAYGGYGARPGPGGQAFVAFGTRAVQVELQSGKKLLIGSQRPEELAQRIMEQTAR